MLSHTDDGNLPMSKIWLALLVSIAHMPCSFGQVSDTLQRVWSDASGKFSLEARLVGIDAENVQLNTSDGRAVKVTINRLGQEEKSFIEAVKHCDESNQQYAKMVQHLPRLAASPTAVAEIFESLHRSCKHGFAAGLFGGTLNAASGDSKKLVNAKRQLDESIQRLRLVHEILPDLHGLTLATALNNRALVAIREGTPASAVNYLSQSAAVTNSLPFIVYHNATILVEAANVAEAAKRSYLGKADRKKLLHILAQTKPQAPNINVPDRYMYSFSHDAFEALLNSISISLVPAVEGRGTIESLFNRAKLLPELTCIECKGTGVYPCPGCAKGVVSNRVREPVGTNPINGDIIYGTRVYPVKCENCDGKGGFKCPHCDNGRLSL